MIRSKSSCKRANVNIKCSQDTKNAGDPRIIDVDDVKKTKHFKCLIDSLGILRVSYFSFLSISFFSLNVPSLPTYIWMTSFVFFFLSVLYSFLMLSKRDI